MASTPLPSTPMHPAISLSDPDGGTMIWVRRKTKARLDALRDGRPYWVILERLLDAHEKAALSGAPTLSSSRLGPASGRVESPSSQEPQAAGPAERSRR